VLGYGPGLLGRGRRVLSTQYAVSHPPGGSRLPLVHATDVAAGEGAVDGGGGGVAARAEAFAAGRFDGAIYGRLRGPRLGLT